MNCTDAVLSRYRVARDLTMSEAIERLASRLGVTTAALIEAIRAERLLLESMGGGR